MSDKENYDSRKSEGYTQKEWISNIDIGQVPEEYKKRINSYEEKLRRYEKG